MLLMVSEQFYVVTVVLVVTSSGLVRVRCEAGQWYAVTGERERETVLPAPCCPHPTHHNIAAAATELINQPGLHTNLIQAGQLTT